MPALDSPIDGLLSTPTARLPYQHDVLLRSYVLPRDGDPVIVYNSPGIDQAADEIRALGEPSRLLINHAHESMYDRPALDVPVWVGEDDRAELGSSMRVAGAFRGRQRIADDLEAIATPGHTGGTTSYLWTTPEHRYLFTGDFVWIEDGEWKAVVLDPGLRDRYVESLETVRDLDFDVLVPWGVTERDAPVAVVRDDAEKRERIQAIIDRVAAGGVR